MNLGDQIMMIEGFGITPEPSQRDKYIELIRRIDLQISDLARKPKNPSIIDSELKLRREKALLSQIIEAIDNKKPTSQLQQKLNILMSSRTPAKIATLAQKALVDYSGDKPKLAEVRSKAKSDYQSMKRQYRSLLIKKRTPTITKQIQSLQDSMRDMRRALAKVHVSIKQLTGGQNMYANGDSRAVVSVLGDFAAPIEVIGFSPGSYIESGVKSAAKSVASEAKDELLTAAGLKGKAAEVTKKQLLKKIKKVSSKDELITGCIAWLKAWNDKNLAIAGKEFKSFKSDWDLGKQGSDPYKPKKSVYPQRRQAFLLLKGSLSTDEWAALKAFITVAKTKLPKPAKFAPHKKTICEGFKTSTAAEEKSLCEQLAASGEKCDPAKAVCEKLGIELPQYAKKVEAEATEEATDATVPTSNLVKFGLPILGLAVVVGGLLAYKNKKKTGKWFWKKSSLSGMNFPCLYGDC